MRYLKIIAQFLFYASAACLRLRRQQREDEDEGGQNSSGLANNANFAPVSVRRQFANFLLSAL